MHLRELAVVDFRSYADAQLSLEPGVTALIGPNGQGKTNLVEAAGYLATLASHRVALDAPLVRAGAERAIVRGLVVRDGRDTAIDVEITPGRANRARLGGAPVPRPREILGTLRTVLFAPEDLAIVKGDPSERRRYLDDVLVARYPRFAAVRADYERVLKQRNALLKSAGAARRQGGSALRTLDVWDAHLANAGAELLAGRLDLIEALRPLVDKAYTTVSRGGAPAGITYKSSMPEEGGQSHDPDVLSAACVALVLGLPAFAQQPGEGSKPNILVIMSDDIGYWNISAYNRGMMGYHTPNIDRIANEGAIFTDYYGQ